MEGIEFRVSLGATTGTTEVLPVLGIPSPRQNRVRLEYGFFIGRRKDGNQLIARKPRSKSSWEGLLLIRLGVGTSSLTLEINCNQPSEVGVSRTTSTTESNPKNAIVR